MIGNAALQPSASMHAAPLRDYAMTQLPFPPNLTIELQHIEQLVLERTRSRAAVISVAGSRLLLPGAVRLRAALVLLAAQIGTYQRERVAHAAAAIELIYAATQTHDDLVDAGERRRGVPRTGEWNHGVALMVGDYLFALAAGEMAQSPDPRVISFYSQAVMRITEATLAPPPLVRPFEDARTHHLEQLGGTVAALSAAACKAGGACGGASPEQIETLGCFGYALALALHLGDETRAFATDAAPDASLRVGVVTLPLLFAATHGDGERLVAALDSSDPAEQAWLSAEVRRHGLAPTRAEVARLIAQAHVALSSLPPGEAREALARVADYAVTRLG